MQCSAIGRCLRAQTKSSRRGVGPRTFRKAGANGPTTCTSIRLARGAPPGPTHSSSATVGSGVACSEKVEQRGVERFGVLQIRHVTGLVDADQARTGNTFG